MPQMLLFHVIWRAVRHQQYLRPRRFGARRRLREPRVFANVDAEADTFYGKYKSLGSWRKVALFIEHCIVRQVTLVIRAKQLAIDDDGCSIESRAVLGNRMPDNHMQIFERSKFSDEYVKRLGSFCVK